MKKILLLLILAMFSLLVMPVSAETSNLTAQEAYDIYCTMYKTQHLFHASFFSSDFETSGKLYIYCLYNLSTGYIEEENCYIIVDPDTFVIESDDRYYKFKSITLNGKTYNIETMNDLKACLSLYMAEQYTDLLLSQGCFVEENQTLYFRPSGADTTSAFLGYKEFMVDGDNATLYIITQKFDMEYGNGKIYFVKIPAVFKKTATGWILKDIDSEGAVDITEEYLKNPSTSSPTPIYLALVGAALVGVCLPVVKRKRRKAD